MQIGDVVHLDGLKAEYSMFGRDRFSACTLPEGEYVVVGVEDGYVSLAWKDLTGIASRKHRYRVEASALLLQPRETATA
jgi:hypothetical protein